MAKKRKIFQKKQLINFFEQGNYQKVISKIKQFTIPNTTSEELDSMLIKCYEGLIEDNICAGDIQRVLRDINTILNLYPTNEYKIYKLKYLCYLERFEEAIEYGKDLIEIKDTKIKKNALFFYILANIYNGNYEINQKQLKLLTVSKKFYILGLIELFKGNKELALEILEKSRPKLIKDKYNIKLIKDIILNNSVDVDFNKAKPLYTFLLSGEDSDIQNTNTTRDAKKNIVRSSSTKDLKNLIELKDSASIESILKGNFTKEKEIKLIYNSLLFMSENNSSYLKVLNIFIKYKDELVLLPESFYLLSYLSKRVKIENPKIFYIFISKYLKLHHKKFLNVQIEFNLSFLITIHYDNVNDIKKIALIYGAKEFAYLFYLTIDIRVIKDSRYKDSLNQSLKIFTKVREELLELFNQSMLNLYSESTNYNIKGIKKELLILFKQFENLEKPHKRYSNIIFTLFISFAKLIHIFDIKKDKDLYISLTEAVTKLMKYFNIKDISMDIKALFMAINLNKNMLIERDKKDINILDFINNIAGGDNLEDLLNNHDIDDLFDDSNNEAIYDFNEVEYDLIKIEDTFLSDLENNIEPFENLELSYNLLSKMLKEDKVLIKLSFRLMDQLIKFDLEYNIFKIFNIFKIYFNYTNELLIRLIVEYSQDKPLEALSLLEIILNEIPSKSALNVISLKCIYEYLIIIDKYHIIEQEDNYIKYCKLFFYAQKKRKFKSTRVEYEKLLKNNKIKGRVI